ncbi:MAG: hypothetical protein EZS28_000740 [Streblomastix strix]|uniref:Uncharacterized protein n=1 Tax=Streblomastix strix TaxID=222440 RepID=A0A5J4X8X6_9EUKA|nr:MAG: hypothetical protein EZS28_000740 [Streblomastix strix]
MVPNKKYLSRGAIEYWQKRGLVRGDVAVVDFCLRMLTPCASEAPCERMISESRLIIGDRRWNTLPGTLQSIIQVAQSLKVND